MLLHGLTGLFATELFFAIEILAEDANEQPCCQTNQDHEHERNIAKQSGLRVGGKIYDLCHHIRLAVQHGDKRSTQGSRDGDHQLFHTDPCTLLMLGKQLREIRQIAGEEQDVADVEQPHAQERKHDGKAYEESNHGQTGKNERSPKQGNIAVPDLFDNATGKHTDDERCDVRDRVESADRTGGHPVRFFHDKRKNKVEADLGRIEQNADDQGACDSFYLEKLRLQERIFAL